MRAGMKICILFVWVGVEVENYFLLGVFCGIFFRGYYK